METRSASEDEESENEDEHVAGWQTPRGARRSRVVLDDDSEADESEQAKPAKQAKLRISTESVAEELFDDASHATTHTYLPDGLPVLTDV